MHWDMLYEAKDSEGREVYQLNKHICPPESGRCFPKGEKRPNDHKQCFWYVVDKMLWPEDGNPQHVSSEQVFGADTLRECKAWALEEFGIKAKRISGEAMQMIDFDTPDDLPQRKD